jgi:hypothetical protein
LQSSAATAAATAAAKAAIAATAAPIAAQLRADQGRKTFRASRSRQTDCSLNCALRDGRGPDHLSRRLCRSGRLAGKMDASLDTDSGED